MDVTTEDENGKKWDVPDLKTQKNRAEPEGGSSTVISSITSFYHVRHDAVPELHKAER